MNERKSTRTRGPKAIVVVMVTVLALLTAPLCAPLCAARTCPATAAPSEQCHDSVVSAAGSSQGSFASARTCSSRDIPAALLKYEGQSRDSGEGQYAASARAGAGSLASIPAFESAHGLRWCQSPPSAGEASSILLTTKLRI